MNPRIRELARQAANGMLSFDAEGDWRLNEKEVEKFAELIVRECVMFIDKGSEGFSDATWVRTCIKDIGRMIEEHFGVEP